MSGSKSCFATKNGMFKYDDGVRPPEQRPITLPPLVPEFDALIM